MKKDDDEGHQAEGLLLMPVVLISKREPQHHTGSQCHHIIRKTVFLFLFISMTESKNMYLD